MHKKYFFFDIDGTLTTKNPGGEVLPSTLNTIKQLKENGHFVAIATGRLFHDAKDYLDLFHRQLFCDNDFTRFRYIVRSG